MISSILATDIKNHFPLMKEFEMKLAQKAEPEINIFRKVLLTRKQRGEPVVPRRHDPAHLRLHWSRKGVQRFQRVE